MSFNAQLIQRKLKGNDKGELEEISTEKEPLKEGEQESKIKRKQEIRDLWGRAAKKASLQAKTPNNFSRFCHLVSHTTDSSDDRKRKGLVLLFGLGSVIYAITMALVLRWNAAYTGSLLELGHALASFCTIIYFISYKDEIMFCRLQLLFIFLFPILAQLTSAPTFSLGSLSIWSFLAPFGALIYFHDSANYWFAAFVIANSCLILFQSFQYALAELHEVIHLINDLAICTLLYLSLKAYIGELRKHQQKLGVLNAFLHLHNRKLVDETEQLKIEVIKLQDMKKQDVHRLPSLAEEIITVMRQLKNADPFKEHEKDINYVISVLGSGKALYVPDVEKIGESKMDEQTKELLLYHHSAWHNRSSSNLLSLSSPRKSSNSSPSISNSSYLNDERVMKLFERVSEWDFDVFALNDLTSGRPLYHMGLMLFKVHNLCEKFDIEESTLHNFLTLVEQGYRKDNPYHNNIHAADVTQSLNFLLTKIGSEKFNDSDILAAIVSAIIHDFEHPGVNNAFEITSGSSRALTYNDKSVLENYHLSSAFHILHDSKNNIFKNLSKEMRMEIRSIIIEMVLATDFGRHLEVLGQFNTRRAAGGFSKDKKEDRVLLLKMALKCADIGHTAKFIDNHLKWTARITDEFYLQGDRERSLGFQISPSMDRTTPELFKSQIGFISFLVAPLYSAFVEEFPATKLCFDNLQSNLAHWKSKEEQRVKEEAKKREKDLETM